jgi:hypothetical protein
MKTAGRGTQNRYATVRSKASTWSARLEQILLNYPGWETRKNPAVGEAFFLTSPFIALAAPGGWLSEPETPAEIGNRELT